MTSSPDPKPPKDPRHANLKPGNSKGRKATKPRAQNREKFIEVYAKTGNGTEAALAAGYSPHTAGSQANYLLKLAEIDARIQERRRDFEAASNIKHSEIIGGFVKEAQNDVSELFDDTGAFIGMAEARRLKLGHLIKAVSFREPREKTAAVCKACGGECDISIKITRIEVHNQQTARAHLAEIFGLKQAPRMNDRDKIELSRKIRQDWTFYTNLAARVLELHGVDLGRDGLIDTVVSGYELGLQAAVRAEIERIDSSAGEDNAPEASQAPAIAITATPLDSDSQATATAETSISAAPAAAEPAFQPGNE